MPGARRVELTLPATGVCSAQPSDTRVPASVASAPVTSCCGGPAPAEVDACCAQDAEAKAIGQDGCGCGSDTMDDAAGAGAVGGERPVAITADPVERAAAAAHQCSPERRARAAAAASSGGGPGPTRRFTPARYGWVIVATLSVTETVTWGIVYYGFPVFLRPMEQDLGASRVAITGAFSVGLGVSALAALPVGRWIDRHGPVGS